MIRIDLAYVAIVGHWERDHFFRLLCCAFSVCVRLLSLFTSNIMSTETPLKGEKSLLGEEKEKTGVAEILKALTDDEKDAMPDENMPLRHLRAEKGDVPLAIKKMKAALAWRKEFEVDKIVNCFEEGGDEEMRKIITEENSTGKIYVRGFDEEGRAAMYMRPHRENTHNEKNNMRHLVWNLEKAIACTRQKSGYEKINLMIDYDGFRLRDTPPLSTSKYTLDILQKHYPERMFKAYVLNPPFVFRAFWTVIKPLVDEKTKEKIVFCHGKGGAKLVAERFNMDVVEPCAGGEKEKVKEFISKDYLGLKYTETL